MVQIPDEMLMAYADGELAREQAQALEALLRDDAGLRARLAPFVATGDPLAKVFEPRLAEPIPDRLIETIARTQPLRAPGRSRPAWPRLGELLGAAAAVLFPQGLSLATAASVALLVSAGALGGWLAGRSQAPAPSAGLVAAAGPGLVASGVLAQTLETAPSRSTFTDTPGDAVVPVLSFRTGNGDVCRQYYARGPADGPDYAGLACRMPDGVWRVALHVQAAKAAPGTPGASYQTATEAARVPAVEAHVDTIIAGDALGVEEEAALLANGWQHPALH